MALSTFSLSLAGGAVRVELKVLANPHAHRNLTGSARYAVERRTERLTFALRGKPRGRSW